MRSEGIAGDAEPETAEGRQGMVNFSRTWRGRVMADEGSMGDQINTGRGVRFGAKRF